MTTTMLSVLVLCLGAEAPVAPAAGTGAIDGRVVDSLSVPIGGASVEASRGRRRVRAVSASDGGFRLEGLAPGAYTVSAALSTGSPTSRSVEVSAGSTARVDLVVSVTIAETVEVRGSFARATTSGTRTDTPLKDIPQAISVIPRQILEQQASVRVTEAITNASGVVAASGAGGTSENFNVRGQAQFAPSQNGIISRVSFGGFEEVANLERVEVLKGPASALYGPASPGGFVNLVTKRPEAEPRRQVTLRAGQESFYYGSVDVTGPVGSRQRVLYRLVAAYEDTGSFREFIESNRVFVAPSVSLRLGDRTSLLVSGEYRDQDTGFDLGIPAIGTGVADVPRERNVGEPWERALTTQRSAGYFVDHQFNSSWSLRNNFRYRDREIDQRQIAITLRPDGRTLTRTEVRSRTYTPVWDAQLDVVGSVATGAVAHRLLIGVDYNLQDGNSSASARPAVPSIDLFAPVHPVGDRRCRCWEPRLPRTRAKDTESTCRTSSSRRNGCSSWSAAATTGSRTRSPTSPTMRSAPGSVRSSP